MALDFITADPSTDAYDRAQLRAEKQAKLGQEIDVDTAVRQGIGDSLKAPAQTYAPPPAAPQAPSPAPSGRPAITPFTAKNLPPGISPDDDLLVRTVHGEAAGEPPEGQRAVAGVIRNRAASSGKSISDVVFAPNQFEPWNNPTTRAKLETLDPNSPDYQRILANVRQGGDPTNGSDHFFSPTAQAALGRQQPEWANTEPSAVIGRHNFYKIGYSPPASAPNAVAQGGGSDQNNGVSPPLIGASWLTGGNGSQTFMPGSGTSRYDPVLQRLAATPGGGAAGLKLLESQGRFDVANYKRVDQYQKLAMSALAHGDPTTARYYAQIGGLDVPEGVFAGGPDTMKLTGRGALLSHQVYQQNPEQARVFLQTYIGSGGNVDQAFAAAGPPRSNPNYKVEWVKQADGQLQAFNVDRRGSPAVPVIDQSGQPLTKQPNVPASVQLWDRKLADLSAAGDPNPVQTLLRQNPELQVQWVRQDDQTMKPMFFNKRTGQLGEVTQQGTGAPVPNAAPQAPKETVLAQKVRMLEEADVPKPDAIQAAMGIGLKPATVATAYRSVLNAYINSIPGMNANEAQRQAYVTGQMNTMFGQNWQSIMQGASVAPPATPTPAAPTGMVAPPVAAAPSAPAAPSVPPPSAPSAPMAPGITAAPTPDDIARNQAAARAAVAKGAPRDKVVQRLQAAGIPVPPDLMPMPVPGY